MIELQAGAPRHGLRLMGPVMRPTAGAPVGRAGRRFAGDGWLRLRLAAAVATHSRRARRAGSCPPRTAAARRGRCRRAAACSTCAPPAAEGSALEAVQAAHRPPHAVLCVRVDGCECACARTRAFVRARARACVRACVTSARANARSRAYTYRAKDRVEEAANPARARDVSRAAAVEAPVRVCARVRARECEGVRAKERVRCAWVRARVVSCACVRVCVHPPLSCASTSATSFALTHGCDAHRRVRALLPCGLLLPHEAAGARRMRPSARQQQ